MATAPDQRTFELTIETPLAVPRNHEVRLLRAAIERNPSVALRSKLAKLLFILDEFDEAIALHSVLLDEAPSFAHAHFLAESYISRETPEDDARSGTAAQRALDLAQTPYQRATALAAIAKALSRQGRTDEARATLIEALDMDPGNVNAYKRLATIDLKAGDSDAILALADALIARGVGHSRLLIARALALGTLGKLDEARNAIGLDTFLYDRVLAPPPGWDSIQAFNAAVRDELFRHPDIRYNRYGTASTNTWRIDNPSITGSRMIPQLQALIRQAVLDYAAGLDAHDAPWVRARPEAAQLHNWCVMTDADGYEEWHVHQNGWLSGVYYVDVPPVVASGDNNEGCIAFGLPEDVVGADMAAAYGEHVVRPAAGKLMLFPSHTYHRTYAHGSEHRRICLAFDIQPL